MQSYSTKLLKVAVCNAWKHRPEGVGHTAFLTVLLPKNRSAPLGRALGDTAGLRSKLQLFMSLADGYSQFQDRSWVFLSGALAVSLGCWSV